MIEEEEPEEEAVQSRANLFGLGSGDLLGGGSGDDILGVGLDDETIEGSGNFTLDDADDEGEEEEEDAEEWVHMNEKYFYMEHIIRLCAIIHSIVSFFMLIAYYHLKVSLSISHCTLFLIKSKQVL